LPAHHIPPEDTRMGYVTDWEGQLKTAFRTITSPRWRSVFPIAYVSCYNLRADTYLAGR
jgi:hypothetical protein